LNTRFDCGARVFSFELAKLPLPREHPERVANFGAQAAIKVCFSRAALEPVERHNRRAKVLAEQRIL
jgi:hypothetical protein